MTLEKRLSEVEQSIKVIAQYVKEQSEKIEGELTSLKGTEAFYDPKPDIEQLKAGVESLRTTSTQPVSLDGDRIKKSIQILRNEFDIFRNEASPKIQYLDKKTDKLRETVESVSLEDVEGLKKYVERVDKKVQDTLALKEELDDINETLTKMKTIANKLKDFDAASYREEFDRHMSDMFGKFEASDMKKINEISEHMKSIEANDMKNLTHLAEQLKDTEIHDFKNLSSKLKHLEKLEADEAKKLVEMVDQLKDVEIHDIRNLAKHLKESKEALEEESVSRLSIDKRLAEIETKFGQLKNIESKDINQLNAAFEHLQGIEMEELKGIAATIKEAKDALEEESVNRFSAEKRLAEFERTLKERQSVLEDKVNKVSEIADHIENIEGLDIQKLSGRINDMESNMKLDTVKLLTQQLNEFAKSVDRRLPNVVSREEYMRQIADLNQRMRTIETPDLSPLGARVERLEKKLDEIANMMRQMYNRVPIVVE